MRWENGFQLQNVESCKRWLIDGMLIAHSFRVARPRSLSSSTIFIAITSWSSSYSEKVFLYESMVTSQNSVLQMQSSITELCSGCMKTWNTIMKFLTYKKW